MKIDAKSDKYFRKTLDLMSFEKFIGFIIRFKCWSNDKHGEKSNKIAKYDSRAVFKFKYI